VLKVHLSQNMCSKFAAAEANRSITYVDNGGEIWVVGWSDFSADLHSRPAISCSMPILLKLSVRVERIVMILYARLQFELRGHSPSVSQC
jgi:hypothetical protein